MTKVAIADDIAEKICGIERPIELVDAAGQTIGFVHRPPTTLEIERARTRSIKRQRACLMGPVGPVGPVGREGYGLK